MYWVRDRPYIMSSKYGGGQNMFVDGILTDIRILKLKSKARILLVKCFFRHPLEPNMNMYNIYRVVEQI